VPEEADRFGFAYGTLPGHPECDEEGFQVVRGADRGVTFDILVFSPPADWMVRVASPIARAVQSRVTKGYLEGVRRYVARGNGVVTEQISATEVILYELLILFLKHAPLAKLQDDLQPLGGLWL
jgi:Domain of unknown function (DUF1990)